MLLTHRLALSSSLAPRRGTSQCQNRLPPCFRCSASTDAPGQKSWLSQQLQRFLGTDGIKEELAGVKQKIGSIHSRMSSMDSMLSSIDSSMSSIESSMSSNESGMRSIHSSMTSIESSMSSIEFMLDGLTEQNVAEALARMEGPMYVTSVDVGSPRSLLNFLGGDRVEPDREVWVANHLPDLLQYLKQVIVPVSSVRQGPPCKSTAIRPAAT